MDDIYAILIYCVFVAKFRGKPTIRSQIVEKILFEKKMFDWTNSASIENGKLVSIKTSNAKKKHLQQAYSTQIV